ncbi:MAG TPA: C39 family peptidase [Nocardioidaceae bacterium]|nr:C39 family peptidase [Nocardioidaceae bacterium]
MRHIVYEGWRTGVELDKGTHRGTTIRGEVLVLDEPTGERDYTDPHGDGAPVRYEEATWVSPDMTPSFPVSEVIPSWNAATPPGTWIEVAVSATTSAGAATKEYVLARWAESDRDIHPTSVPDQSDEHARVAIDVLRAAPGHTFATFRLHVRLLRRVGPEIGPEIDSEIGSDIDSGAGAETGPSVSLVGAMASNLPRHAAVEPSAGAGAHGQLIDVPPLSQQLHLGEYPQWGNGGESWCSPTATTMVLAHWGRGPQPEEYAWVEPHCEDRVVDFAARHVFDHNYQGPGNWSFNTAYAARYGMRAFVTRLRSLAEAEEFIKAGIPLIVSVSFTRDQLDGAGYDTQGHLLTIVGFDESGNVICNDPASHKIPSNGEVRTTYAREQFERVWQSPSGGLTYVIHPPEKALPERTEQPNW